MMLSVNQPCGVLERSNADKRAANVDVLSTFFIPLQTHGCTFEDRAAVLTLIERRWRSHGALAGLISMAL